MSQSISIIIPKISVSVYPRSIETSFKLKCLGKATVVSRHICPGSKSWTARITLVPARSASAYEFVRVLKTGRGTHLHYKNISQWSSADRSGGPFVDVFMTDLELDRHNPKAAGKRATAPIPGPVAPAARIHVAEFTKFLELTPDDAERILGSLVLADRGATKPRRIDLDEWYNDRTLLLATNVAEVVLAEPVALR